MKDSVGTARRYQPGFQSAIPPKRCSGWHRGFWCREAYQLLVRNRPCRYGELRGFSRLGPLRRLVIKAVEAALYVVLLDKVGVRALVDVEG